MTSEQKRIAIAEACGWMKGRANVNPDLSPADGFWLGGKFHVGISALPDYFNDLNAMHDAEEMLTTPEQRYNFISILYDIVNNFIPDEVDDYVPDYWEVSSVQVFPHLHATAAQRAEAFGLTLKLW